eukprot:8087499-Lingulodinium_polyedra.AAC.1
MSTRSSVVSSSLRPTMMASHCQTWRAWSSWPGGCSSSSTVTSRTRATRTGQGRGHSSASGSAAAAPSSAL